ncbi:putative permease YjgP/YjgQ [mine drainage metagenome]|uniref:Putative permease YjgP/YjgQ n=1 Tax=mine drainage metagenome TaxID=410659 RepID=T1CDH5_9ZZZZ
MLPTATWKTGLSPRLLELSVLSPNTQAISDLLRNIEYLHGNGLDARVYTDALWQRLFYPLNVLMLVLCTLPLAFGTLRAGGFGKRLLIGLLIAVGWFFLQRALVNLAIVYSVPAWLANLGPILLLAGVAIWVFRRRHA